MPQPRGRAGPGQRVAGPHAGCRRNARPGARPDLLPGRRRGSAGSRRAGRVLPAGSQEPAEAAIDRSSSANYSLAKINGVANGRATPRASTPGRGTGALTQGHGRAGAASRPAPQGGVPGARRAERSRPRPVPGLGGGAQPNPRRGGG